MQVNQHALKTYFHSVKKFKFEGELIHHFTIATICKYTSGRHVSSAGRADYVVTNSHVVSFALFVNSSD